ncbi:M50 family metallopeptidase [Leptospira sp. GIMC2001]|uniref:M50 family metallopeptidase n=1 Tax=Leptospira sp. GIMC2001 TaxID=1513297 RepID=UPI00234BFCD5|nr:M50 family metallopeptidase [Leptospira sp. GIMC2001]WCL48965.1 M50 family metallopeptidase [Leptospira sp. GIMC2001]
MSSRSFQFILFLSLLLSLISFWDHPLMASVKEFVVLIHEICHAVAALLTGGDVKNIAIHGDESGETVTLPSTLRGSFLFVVSAGYLGTSLIGGVLLYKGFTGRNTKTTLILLAILVFLLTMKYSNVGEFAYTVGVAWSLGIFFAGFLGKHLSSIALVFLGTTISLYSIYDLSDFARHVHQTDAGILAYWLTGYNVNLHDKPPASVLILGYLVAITWSLISIGTIYSFVMRSISHGDGIMHEPSSQSPSGIDPNFQEMFPGELTPEVVDWFLARGLDLNGRPLTGELVDGFQKDSEMT